MKLTVFEYYNRFYKHVLDEKEYEKNRFQVYRFLIGAAKDGAVPPSILPGSTKLGRERTRICPEAVTGEGILASSYRSRKLLDRYLEIAALKYGLSLEEIRMIMFLDHAPPDQYKERSGRLHRHDHARPDTYASEAGSKKADPDHRASRREENKIRRPRPFSAQAPGYCISFRFGAHSPGTPDRTE